MHASPIAIGQSQQGDHHRRRRAARASGSAEVTCNGGASGKGEHGAGRACGRGGSTDRALCELVHIRVENEAQAISLAR